MTNRQAPNHWTWGNLFFAAAKKSIAPLNCGCAIGLRQISGPKPQTYLSLSKSNNGVTSGTIGIHADKFNVKSIHHKLWQTDSFIQQFLGAGVHGRYSPSPEFFFDFFLSNVVLCHLFLSGEICYTLNQFIAITCRKYIVLYDRD